MGLINIHSVAKYQKNSKGGPFGDIEKFSEKNRTVPKKSKGDPLGTSGFVGFIEKVKKAEPFTLIRFCRLRLKSKKPKGELFGDKKNFEKKSHSAEKNRKGGPFSPFWLCRVRLKSKKPKGGPFGIT